MGEPGYVLLVYRYPVLPAASPDWESAPYARMEPIKQAARSHYLAHSARHHYEIQAVEVGKKDGAVQVLSRKTLLEATPEPGTVRIRWVSCENRQECPNWRAPEGETAAPRTDRHMQAVIERAT